MFRRKCFVAALVVLLMAGLGTVVEAVRTGAPSGFNGSIASHGSTCKACHSPGSGGSGLVEIFGAPEQYVPSETYDITVRITDAVQAGAGFELSVEDSIGTRIGSLTPDGVLTKFSGTNHNWVTHTGAGVDASIAAWVVNGGSYEYTVPWTAPASNAGPIVFYAAGNAINNDDDNDGDYVYLAQAGAIVAGIDCDAITSISANCKPGKFKLVAKLKTTLATGTVLSLIRDGSEVVLVTINDKGKGKNVWKGMSTGSHTVCVGECDAICATTSCSP